MTIDLFHGAHTSFTAHEGQCWTEDVDSADRYSQHEGPVAMVSIDTSALTVEECAGYDWDTNEAPADSATFRAAAAARGVDILTYTDADEQGQEHECYRVVSARAVSLIVSSFSMVERDEDGDLIET